jgi:hypothetical protein
MQNINTVLSLEDFLVEYLDSHKEELAGYSFTSSTYDGVKAYLMLTVSII